MKYFFDNNISYRLANMLSALDQNVVALREEFQQDIKDPELLKALAGRDLVFVSAEVRMRTSAVEAPLLKAANITSLFFASFYMKMDFWAQAAWLIKRWPTIDKFAQGAAKGTCAEVKQNGKSELFRL